MLFCGESRCYSVLKRRDWIQDRVCVAALKNLLDPVTGKRMRVSACLPTTTGPRSPQAHWWRGGGLMGPPAALQGGEALRHRNGASGEAEALFRCCFWPPTGYPRATFGLTSMPTTGLTAPFSAPGVCFTQASPPTTPQMSHPPAQHKLPLLFPHHSALRIPVLGVLPSLHPN